MPQYESPATVPPFPVELARARANLRPPMRRERVWPPFAAALLFAVCALSFATAAILAPPVQLTPIAAARAPG